MFSGTERRAFPRWKTPQGSYVSFAEGTGPIADLGLGGVRIDDPEAMPPGRRLDMRIHLFDQIIPCTGLVRRSSEGSTAIQFVDFPHGQRSRLRAFLFRLESR